MVRIKAANQIMIANSQAKKYKKPSFDSMKDLFGVCKHKFKKLVAANRTKLKEQAESVESQVPRILRKSPRKSITRTAIRERDFAKEIKEIKNDLIALTKAMQSIAFQNQRIQELAISTDFSRLNQRNSISCQCNKINIIQNITIQPPKYEIYEGNLDESMPQGILATENVPKITMSAEPLLSQSGKYEIYKEILEEPKISEENVATERVQTLAKSEFDLPISSIEEFTAINQRIAEDEYFKINLIYHLSGWAVDADLRPMVDQIFTEEFVMQISLIGKHTRDKEKTLIRLAAHNINDVMFAAAAGGKLSRYLYEKSLGGALRRIKNRARNRKASNLRKENKQKMM